MDRAPIRSFQRVFRPQRRIYHVEGHRLPVPGGVPLRGVLYALGALLAVLVLSSRPLTLALPAAVLVVLYGLAAGGGSMALAAGGCVLGALQLVGWMLSTLDWPVRLLVVPVAVATMGTQATPDGRAAHRYALSWLGLQLRSARRSLGRPVAACDRRGDLSGRVWVAADERSPILRAGRVHGPAVVHFATSRLVSRHSRRGRRLRTGIRTAGGRFGERAVLTNRVELVDGERLEVRP